MADIAQGRTPGAGEALEELRVQVDGWFRTPFPAPDPETSLWYDGIIGRILLKEAEDMLARSH